MSFINNHNNHNKYPDNNNYSMIQMEQCAKDVTNGYVRLHIKKFKLPPMPTYLIMITLKFVFELFREYFTNDNRYSNKMNMYFGNVAIPTYKAYLLHPGDEWKCDSCGTMNDWCNYCSFCSFGNKQNYYPVYQWVLNVNCLTGGVKIVVNALGIEGTIWDHQLYSFGIIIFGNRIYKTKQSIDQYNCVLKKLIVCDEIHINDTYDIFIEITHQKLTINIKNKINSSKLTWKIPDAKYTLHVGIPMNSRNSILMKSFSQIA